MAFTVGRFGLSTIWALAFLVLTAWTTLAFFALVVLGAICRCARIRLFGMMRLLREELLIVIGTSSSETAIPGMMRKLAAAGVPNAVTGLVIRPAIPSTSTAWRSASRSACCSSPRPTASISPWSRSSPRSS